jgi:hypothetical protein
VRFDLEQEKKGARALLFGKILRLNCAFILLYILRVSYLVFPSYTSLAAAVPATSPSPLPAL